MPKIVTLLIDVNFTELTFYMKMEDLSRDNLDCILEQN